MISIKSVPRKIVKLIKAKYLLRKMAGALYQTLPKVDSHQEEADENAINEALEARLMALIASAPQQNLEAPWLISVDEAEDRIYVPAASNLDWPTYQTFCQTAQPQGQ